MASTRWRDPRIWLRLLPSVLVTLIVMACAFAPYQSWRREADFRGNPGACRFILEILPPTGKEWNPGFELREIQLLGRDSIPGVSASYTEDWMPGHPRARSILISDGQSERILLALHRDGFFEEAGEEPPPQEASFHLEVHGPWYSLATGRPFDTATDGNPTNAVPCVLSISHGWEPSRIARRLKAIRKVLDGAAADALDQLIRQIPSVPR